MIFSKKIYFIKTNEKALKIHFRNKSKETTSLEFFKILITKMFLIINISINISSFKYNKVYILYTQCVDLGGGVYRIS